MDFDLDLKQDELPGGAGLHTNPFSVQVGQVRNGNPDVV
jgi:hypothetical protein